MKVFQLLLLLLSLTACKNAPENITVVEEQPLRLLSLGDSYTIGQGVNVNDRWPMQLISRLRMENFKLEEPRYIAATGWTTGDLLRAMELHLNNEKFDLVSVLIGVNNQFQGKSMEEYETELREIFRRAVKHSKNGAAGVFALSIPDYGVTPFGLEKEEEIKADIDAFNAIFEAVAQDFQVDFYNITPISRSAKNKPVLIAEDGLHPSATMYSLWVQQIVPDLVNKLEY